MAVSVLLPRGTRAALDALATAGSLVVGKIYWITDEKTVAVATATNAYATVSPNGRYRFINTYAADRTLALIDAGGLIRMNVATANNFTIPPNSSVAFDIGTVIDGLQYGAGLTTIVAGSGVTVQSRGSALKSAGQYAGWSAVKTGTDEWWVTGDLTT